MLIEHARNPQTGEFLYDANGLPVRKYHFTETRTEEEFVRRMDQRGLSPDEAYKSMCTCAKQICQTHGARSDPYPFDKLPPEQLGAASFIRQYKDEAGNWSTDLVLGRLDLVGEARSRMASGMPMLDAFHSLCQCNDQICPAHGARMIYNAKSYSSNPRLGAQMSQLEARRFAQ